MMARIILVLTIIAISIPLLGQQHTSYTQYTLNRFALNPAVAGLNNCSETTLGNRTQWVGFEGAPSIYFASFHTRLYKENRFPKTFHGVGAVMMNDRNGFSNTFYVKLAYAYHIKLWTNYHMSVGLFGGIRQQQVSFNKIQISSGTGTDPALEQEEGKRNLIYPEVSPGGFIYNKNFFLGLSLFQVYPAQAKNLGTKKNRLTQHIFFSGGYRFRGKQLHFIPSYMINFAPIISPTVDLTLTVDYKQKIAVALGSKYLNSGYATLQLNLGQSLKLGYSYEYAFNEISKVAPTTHEIVLQFNTCKVDDIKKKVVCPAYQ